MRKSIVCAGIICLDLVNTLPHDLEVGGKYPGASLMMSPGGIVKNTAEVLARMGHDAKLLSAAGYDTFSSAAVDGCKAAGIDVSLIRREEGVDIVTCIEVVDRRGDMFIMTGTAVNENSTVTLQQVIDADDVLSKAGVFMLCPSLPDESWDYIIRTYPHIPIVADAGAAGNVNKLLPYLKYLHTFKVNKREAEAFCGYRIQSEDDLRRAANDLLQKGVKNIVITLGEEGAVYANADYYGFFPAKPVAKVVNTSGAGDSFVAGLIHGYLNDLPIETTMEIAAACSRLSIQSDHTINPDITLQAVLEEMHR